MTKTNKLLIVMILISSLFLAIGYAAIENITLDIKGMVTAIPTTRILVTGQNFNMMLKGSTSASTSNTTITKIVFDYWDYGYSDDGEQIYSNEDWINGKAIDVDGLGGIRLFKSSDGTKAYILSEAPIYANENTAYIFRAFNSVTEIVFNNFNTSRVTTMYRMFSECSKLNTLDLSRFNTSNVTSMYGMFNECSALTQLELDNFDTSKVTTMYYMFKNCSALTSLDLSNFNTARVTTMHEMFANCYLLKTLNVSNFNTAKVTTMQAMFNNCKALSNLDISSFDTSNVTSMEYMFRYNTALVSLNLSNFNTAKVTTMSEMFANCYSLESLDVSNFDTTKVTTMKAMFHGCKLLTCLDISSFNTSNVKNMVMMFYKTSSLKSIYIGNKWSTANLTDSTDMFIYATSLIGGAGTTYDSNYVDATYARVDGGPNSESPGYLTLKSST